MMTVTITITAVPYVMVHRLPCMGVSNTDEKKARRPIHDGL